MTEKERRKFKCTNIGPLEPAETSKIPPIKCLFDSENIETFSLLWLFIKEKNV